MAAQIHLFVRLPITCYANFSTTGMVTDVVESSLPLLITVNVASESPLMQNLEVTYRPIELKTLWVFSSNKGERYVLSKPKLQHLPSASLCDAGNPLATETF